MSGKITIIVACASVLLGAVGTSSSRAATSIAAIAVSATVNAMCQIGTAPMSSTGSASNDYASTVKNAQAALTVRCDMTVPYTVSVDVKAGGLAEPTQVTSASTPESSVQHDRSASVGSANHSDLVLHPGDQHMSEHGSGSEDNSGVVVTTVTY